MSGSDDNATTLAEVSNRTDDLTADYRARVQEHRKKRRDSKMTARPPGKATKTLGRPAIFGDTTEIVRPRQTTGPEPNDTAASIPKQPAQVRTAVSVVENVVVSEDAKVSELSVEEEISHHLRALYNARKHGRARGTDSAFAEMQTVDEAHAPVKTTEGTALKRRSTLTGSLARKLLLPTTATEVQSPSAESTQRPETPQDLPASTSPKPRIKPPENEAARIFVQIHAPDKDGETESVAEIPAVDAPSPEKLAPKEVRVPDESELPTPPPEAQPPPAVVKKPRYKTDLILAGTETGIKNFTDRYGRRIEAYYSKVLSLPDQFYLISQDGQFAQGFQLCPGQEYWGARHDDNGKVVARMVLNMDTGTIVGENLLSRSLIRIDPSGDRVEQVSTPAGKKVTIHFADDKTAKKHTGNPNLAVRYCEYSAAGWMIRRDDYLRTGVVESSFFDANMRIPSAERRLRAVTRMVDRQGVKEKSHEEFTYHPERHEAVRIRGSYTDAAGKVTDMHFTPGNNAPVKIKITDTSGFTSQLALNPSTHSYEGTCSDRNGTIVEDIIFDGRTLTYRNRGNGKLSRKETFDLLSGDTKTELQARSTPMSWNAIRGRAEMTLSTGTRVLKYPTGRTDKVEKDGTVTWEGQAGERSFAAPSGEALVTNPDGSAIRLHRNYSAELKESITSSFIKGSLSEAQKNFLEKNRSKLDLRDFARFSQQWYKQPEKLEAVLRQLDYLLIARYRDVTLDQVEEIRNCVLHHIAYPEEIFQGHATTSAAAVVQRLFAADLPARYVSIVKESLTGRLTVAGSEVLTLDVQNMLYDDMSTRDLASRLFQTLVMRAALHPQNEYDNGWTGLGIAFNGAPGKSTFMPAGLTAEMTSNVVHKISGVETAVIEIRSIEELRHAYTVNGRRNMIIAVDGNDPPLGCYGSFERQLVTVTGFVDGRVPRIMVANQLGSRLNRCERRSAIDARIVFESMMRCAASAGEKTAIAIIFGGHHATRYKIEAGKLTPTTSGSEKR